MLATKALRTASKVSETSAVRALSLLFTLPICTPAGLVKSPDEHKYERACHTSDAALLRGEAVKAPHDAHQKAMAVKAEAPYDLETPASRLA